MRNRRIALGALLVLVLAACSGAATSADDDDAAGSTDAARASASPGGASADASDASAGTAPADAGGASAGAAADCEVGEVDGELALFNWTEYMDPALIERFREEFGVDVVEDFYPSNEEMLARVEGGSTGYDMVVPSDYMIEIMREQDLLMTLDKDAIPNAVNLGDDFTSPPYDPELENSMPYQWGTTALALSLADVGEDPEPTWGWIFDPSMGDDLDGRLVMLDSPRETMSAALQYLGYSANTTDAGEVREAADLLAETSDRIAAFESDQFEDLLVNGTAAVVQGYSGDFFGLFEEEDVWDEYAYVVPKEGAIRWVDNMAILADAPHPCTAHTFINYMLDAHNGAELTNWSLYASPNAAAEEFIDAEILENPAIYPPQDVLDNLEILQDTGETESLYTELFEEATS